MALNNDLGWIVPSKPKQINAKHMDKDLGVNLHQRHVGWNNDKITAKFTVLNKHPPCKNRSQKMHQAGVASAFCKIDLDKRSKSDIVNLLNRQPSVSGFCIAFESADRVLLACIRREYFISKDTVEICYTDGKNEFGNVNCNAYQVIRAFIGGISPKKLNHQIKNDIQAVCQQKFALSNSLFSACRFKDGEKKKIAEDLMQRYNAETGKVADAMRLRDFYIAKATEIARHLAAKSKIQGLISVN